MYSFIYHYYYYCLRLAKVKLIGHPQIFLVVQLWRLFDWTNMAAALPQFFGAARQQCVEVRFQWSHDSPVFNITEYFTNYENETFNNTMNVCDIEYNLLLLVWFTNYIYQ